MATNKTDRAFKILTNRRVTSEDKEFYEEIGAETITVTADQLWAQTVPENDPATGISNSVVEFRSQLALTEDVTVADSESWYAADGDGYRLLDWISDRFGSDYRARLYDNNGSEIFPTDALNWFFDYPTGILTISGDASVFAQPFLLDGYRYVGEKGVSQGGGAGSGVIVVADQAGRDAATVFDGYQVYQQDFDVLWLRTNNEWQIQSIQPQYDPYEDGYGLYFWIDASSGDDNNDGLDVSRPRQTLLSFINDFNRIKHVDGFVKLMFAPGTYDTELLPDLNIWCRQGLRFQAQISEFASLEYVSIPGGTGALGDGYESVWEVTTSGFTSFGDHEKCFWVPDGVSPSGDLVFNGDVALLESSSPVLRRVSSSAPSWSDGYLADFEVVMVGGHMFSSHGSVIQASHIHVDLDYTVDIFGTGAVMHGWQLNNCKMSKLNSFNTTVSFGTSTVYQSRFFDIESLSDNLRSVILPGIVGSSVVAGPGLRITLRVEDVVTGSLSYYTNFVSSHFDRLNVENGTISINSLYCSDNTYFEMNHTAGFVGSSIDISGGIDVNGRVAGPFISLESLSSVRQLGPVNLINCLTYAEVLNYSLYRIQNFAGTEIIGTTTGPVWVVKDGGRITGLERSSATNSGTSGQDIQVGGTRNVMPGYLSNAEMASNGIASSEDGSIVQYNDDNI